MEYAIELQADVETDGVDLPTLEQLAARALDAEAAPRPCELSIVLTGDAAVRELNRAYRGVDDPTDVLSFAQSEGGEFARPEGEAPHLGDVIISIDTARRQAAEYGLALQDEVSHLLVHGVLHLLGYNHEHPADSQVMRQHEDAILGEAHHH